MANRNVGGDSIPRGDGMQRPLDAMWTPSFPDRFREPRTERPGITKSNLSQAECNTCFQTPFDDLEAV